MKSNHFRFSSCAVSLCAAVAIVSGCGGSQGATASVRRRMRDDGRSAAGC